jgi:hypothetical protein
LTNDNDTPILVEDSAAGGDNELTSVVKTPVDKLAKKTRSGQAYNIGTD